MEGLRDWLNDACERRNLTWRQASTRAGINPGAISGIMNGERPGLEVCKALAQSFGTSPEHVLRMAGHLPPLPDTDFSPSVEAKRRRVAERLAGLDETSQHRVIDALLSLIEVEERLTGADKSQAHVLPQTRDGERSHP